MEKKSEEMDAWAVALEKKGRNKERTNGNISLINKILLFR